VGDHLNALLLHVSESLKRVLLLSLPLGLGSWAYTSSEACSCIRVLFALALAFCDPQRMWVACLHVCKPGCMNLWVEMLRTQPACLPPGAACKPPSASTGTRWRP
jgi:hypothetical protein